MTCRLFLFSRAATPVLSTRPYLSLYPEMLPYTLFGHSLPAIRWCVQRAPDSHRLAPHIHATAGFSRIGLQRSSERVVCGREELALA